MAVLIIAEAGVNHNGSLDLALQLVDAAADAGADIVKFQTFRADQLTTRQVAKADYQARLTDAAESQQEMLRRLELSPDAHYRLMSHCAARGIGFLSTPFDPDSLRFLLDDLRLPCLKIGSGDLTNAPLLLEAAQAGVDLILSSGMATLGEIEQALGVIAFGYCAEPGAPPSEQAFLDAWASDDGQRALRRQVTLLHCTSEYPCPPEAINLRAMDTLAGSFGLRTGYSDHSQGITVALAAVARGAQVIEKHLTLDHELPGPDHKASMLPAELAALVQGVRCIEAALGSPRKIPAAAEWKTRLVARKTIVAARPIVAGEILTADALAIKRAGTGRPPLDYWGLLGKVAPRSYDPDAVIDA